MVLEDTWGRRREKKRKNYKVRGSGKGKCIAVLGVDLLSECDRCLGWRIEENSVIWGEGIGRE